MATWMRPSTVCYLAFETCLASVLILVEIVKVRAERRLHTATPSKNAGRHAQKQKTGPSRFSTSCSLAH